MYKSLKFLSFLLAFFLGSLFYPLVCKAQYAPSLNNNVFTVFTNTTTEMLDLGFVPQELSPYTPVSTSFWNPWDVGYFVLTNFDENDVVISVLDDSQKSELLSQFSIVNADNLSLTVNSDIYCVKMDNGYFTGYCYVDENGDILYYTNDLGGQLMQVKFGGSVKDSQAWQDYFEDLSDEIKDNNNNLFLNGTPSNLTDMSYFLFFGVTGGSRPQDAYYFFIPNQYQKGVIVPNANNNGQIIGSWYCNGTPYVFNHVYGSGTNQILFISYGTYTKDGVSYTKQITQIKTNNLPINASTVPNNTYDNWVLGNNVSNRLFGLNGHVFNSVFDKNTESVAFKELQPDGATIINYNYYYDPTAISELETQLNNLTQVVNSNFNNQNPISENNFPFYYPTTTIQNNPSEIPFPGVENFPGFVPLPVPQLDPFLNYETITQPDSSEVNTSLGNYFIPYLENIFRRYPFSIPWDIKDFLTSFSAEPEPPSWNFDWTITIGNNDYTKHFEGNLSDFNGLAEIFRSLMLISFIFFLCKFSYDHHF